MKNIISTAVLVTVVCGIQAIFPAAQSQAITIGGPCDTALDEYGGQNAQWNFMCIQYALAIGDCIDAGDCDFYN
jgi:hypothetical protein